MKAVIFDVDGTLCDVESVRHYVTGGHRNFDAFHRASLFCAPRNDVLAIWNSVLPDTARVVVTGRDARYRYITHQWLMKHHLNYDALYTRGWSDGRKDTVVKAELLEAVKNDGFQPFLAIDDREDVAQVWRGAGIYTYVLDRPVQVDRLEVIDRRKVHA